MHAAKAKFFLLGLILLLAAAIAGSGGSLPDMVANHFVAGGLANGYMPRASYLRFTLALAVLLPAIFGFLLPAVIRARGEQLKLPNHDYWLAPERLAGTQDLLASSLRCLAAWQAALIGYVHVLIIHANRLQPARLPERWFVLGMVLFIAGLVAWLVVMGLRFGRIPRHSRFG